MSVNVQVLSFFPFSSHPFAPLKMPHKEKKQSSQNAGPGYAIRCLPKKVLI